MILSDSHCMNISNGLREMHQEDPSVRQRMSETRRGKKRKESSVAATAAAHRGMKRSEETKAKIKAAWVKRKERENEQA